MMPKDWIVFYPDGSYVDSDISVYDVPRKDVQIIVVRDDRVGYKLLHSAGCYFVFDADRDGWRNTDIFGVWDYLVTVRQPVVLFGRNMDSEEFWALRARVAEMCGEKQGWRNFEQKHFET